MNKKQKRTRITATGSGRKKPSDKAAAREKANARLPYKDTIFRMLFNEKGNLLSLYNAVNRESEYATAGSDLCHKYLAGTD